MNAPARKLNLEGLLQKWWSAKQVIQGIEEGIAEQQYLLEDACRDLSLIGDNIGRASECHEETLVYTIDDTTIVLAWQEDQNYHRIELVNVETI